MKLHRAIALLGLGVALHATADDTTLEKGAFRHADLPDWPQTTIDLAPIQAQVAEAAMTRCATRLAGAPLDLGPAESVAAKFAKNAASAAASKALSSVLGGLLGGGGGREEKPPTFKDPIKKKQKREFEDPDSETKIQVGGQLFEDGLLLSTHIDKAPGKGTFHTVFLEKPDCTRIWPTRQMGYSLWGKWSLDVSVTKTTRTYQDGVLVSENVAHSGWSKSGTFDFSRGVSIVETDPLGNTVSLVLDPDTAYLNQLRREIEMPLWREMGYGAPTEGLRGMGAVFQNIQAADLSGGTIAVIHVTRVEKGQYRTVGFPLETAVGADGTLSFSSL
jgi:hypothetical protein